jgi:hypothetical protein
MTRVFVLTALLVGLAEEERPRFRDVEIEKPFDTYLRANPLLMSVTGAKVIRLPDGKRMVVGVASTPLRDGSAKDRKRAETVCKNRALVNILAEKKGVQVAHVEQVKKTVTVVLEPGGKEKAKSVSEYLEMTRSKVEGVVRDFPVIGRWKSADGGLYYLAIGGVLDKNGRVVEWKGPKGR